MALRESRSSDKLWNQGPLRHHVCSTSHKASRWTIFDLDVVPLVLQVIGVFLEPLRWVELRPRYEQALVDKFNVTQSAAPLADVVAADDTVAETTEMTSRFWHRDEVVALRGALAEEQRKRRRLEIKCNEMQSKLEANQLAMWSRLSSKVSI